MTIFVCFLFLKVEGWDEGHGSYPISLFCMEVFTSNVSVLITVEVLTSRPYKTATHSPFLVLSHSKYIIIAIMKQIFYSAFSTVTKEKKKILVAEK